MAVRQRTKAQRQAWWRSLSEDERAAYLGRVAERKRQRRLLDPVEVPERLTRTRLPFEATIKDEAGNVRTIVVDEALC